MGMDVYGKHPANEAGTYFRRTVWGWRPLADLITEEFPGIAAHVKHWQSNDGDGLDAEQSVALAAAMDSFIQSGKAAGYVAARDAELAALPRVKCKWCNGTGTRTDQVGIDLGFAARNWCNGCDGAGDRLDSETSYRLGVDDITEFAQFARYSGGFEIR